MRVHTVDRNTNTKQTSTQIPWLRIEPTIPKAAQHPLTRQTAVGDWGAWGGLMENTGADRHSFSADVMFLCNQKELKVGWEAKKWGPGKEDGHIAEKKSVLRMLWLEVKQVYEQNICGWISLFFKRYFFFFVHLCAPWKHVTLQQKHLDLYKHVGAILATDLHFK